MSDPVRMPNRYKKEVIQIQMKYKEMGVNLTFSQAFEMWIRKIKGLSKVSKKQWKFPEF